MYSFKILLNTNTRDGAAKQSSSWYILSIFYISSGTLLITKFTTDHTIQEKFASNCCTETHTNLDFSFKNGLKALKTKIHFLVHILMAGMPYSLSCTKAPYSLCSDLLHQYQVMRAYEI